MKINNDGFIKTTGNSFEPLTGPQKAAILLAELHDASPEVLKNLNLTAEMKKKLLDAYKSLSPYNGTSPYQVNREIEVLAQSLEFGRRLGIWQESSTNKKQTELRHRIAGKEETAAKLLRALLQNQ